MKIYLWIVHSRPNRRFGLLDRLLNHLSTRVRDKRSLAGNFSFIGSKNVSVAFFPVLQHNLMFTCRSVSISWPLYSTENPVNRYETFAFRSHNRRYLTENESSPTSFTGHGISKLKSVRLFISRTDRVRRFTIVTRFSRSTLDLRLTVKQSHVPLVGQHDYFFRFHYVYLPACRHSGLARPFRLEFVPGYRVMQYFQFVGHWDLIATNRPLRADASHMVWNTSQTPRNNILK